MMEAIPFLHSTLPLTVAMPTLVVGTRQTNQTAVSGPLALGKTKPKVRGFIKRGIDLGILLVVPAVGAPTRGYLKKSLVTSLMLGWFAPIPMAPIRVEFSPSPLTTAI